jgi:hypothetical protein
MCRKWGFSTLRVNSLTFLVFILFNKKRGRICIFVLYFAGCIRKLDKTELDGLLDLFSFFFNFLHLE